MNKWQVFLQYAKAHPDKVPRTTKARAEFYKELQDKCKCGFANDNILCGIIGVPKISGEISSKRDTNALRAQIKALEEQIQLKDKAIQELEEQIQLKDQVIQELDDMIDHFKQQISKKSRNVKSA